MKNQIIISAPGKLMLFGEHAVVHGKQCIVTAVDQRLKIKAQRLEEPEFELHAPVVDVLNYRKPLSELGKGDIPKGAKFVEIATRNFLDSRLRKASGNDSFGVSFETVSQFKSTFGFGSSSASTVCTVKALCELFNVNLSEKEIFDICYKTVLDIQGVGSGFDLAAAIYGQTLYFLAGGKKIEQLTIYNLQLVVGYTGVKADTAILVKEVNARAEKYPKLFKSIFDDIGLIVEEAKIALKKNDLTKLGELMNLNQGYLEALGVGSDKLSNLIYAARNAGALGAKLSGAGGGDCMIALVEEKNRRAVEKAIEKAGGKVLKVEVNAEGVRIERLGN